jgi:ADP-dependent NAD(P)H-hydrate dehydratase / NAD(P)H-hydrate epimerase
MSASLSLYSATQVREIERRAIERHGLSGAELMERAGAAALRELRASVPRARRIAIICGEGNNGGDGYVLARLARTDGLDPWVMAPGSRVPTGDAAAARRQCEAAGVAIDAFAAAKLRGVDAIVDALFGIGLARPVAGEWRVVIDAINASGRPVMALDIPSGLNADTGAVMGAAVQAEHTVSFVALKPGLYTGAGRAYAGRIVLDALGVPTDAYHGIAPAAYRLAPAGLRGLLRPRARDTHKGSFGHVLVVGGAPGMAGAARLCGEAAYRCGAGLVTLATHPTHVAIAGATRPELIVHGVRTAAALKPLLVSSSVVALGPGLGRHAWSRGLHRVALASRLPLVVDADALNLLAEKNMHNDGWILTPHPGEAARLLDTTTDTIQHDRFAAARAIAHRYGGVCVLKGSGTLIATGARESTALCDRGNPGMASGGTGDVLTGVIAALRGQGLAPYDAACAGVWLHASAGDDAAAFGEAGMIASDLMPYLQQRLHELSYERAHD